MERCASLRVASGEQMLHDLQSTMIFVFGNRMVSRKAVKSSRQKSVLGTQAGKRIECGYINSQSL